MVGSGITRGLLSPIRWRESRTVQTLSFVVHLSYPSSYASSSRTKIKIYIGSSILMLTVGRYTWNLKVETWAKIRGKCVIWVEEGRKCWRRDHFLSKYSRLRRKPRPHLLISKDPGPFLFYFLLPPRETGRERERERERQKNVCTQRTGPPALSPCHQFPDHRFNVNSGLWSGGVVTIITCDRN